MSENKIEDKPKDIESDKNSKILDVRNKICECSFKRCNRRFQNIDESSLNKLKK